MRIAGVLALLLASVVGAWTAVNFANNEQAWRLDAGYMDWVETNHPVAYESASAQVREDQRKEKFDAMMGIVAASALVAGVALFARGKGAGNSAA